MQSKITPLKRTGLHRLMCAEQCGSAVYMTMVQVERGPLPVCGCGARLLPEHPELARRVLSDEDLKLHPWHAELERQTASVADGQLPHRKRSLGLKEFRSEYEVASERVARDMRCDAKRRQLAGLLQFTSAAVAAEGMPF